MEIHLPVNVTQLLRPADAKAGTSAVLLEKSASLLFDVLLVAENVRVRATCWYLP